MSLDLQVYSIPEFLTAGIKRLDSYLVPEFEQGDSGYGYNKGYPRQTLRSTDVAGQNPDREAYPVLCCGLGLQRRLEDFTQPAA